MASNANFRVNTVLVVLPVGGVALRGVKLTAPAVAAVILGTTTKHQLAPNLTGQFYLVLKSYKIKPNHFHPLAVLNTLNTLNLNNDSDW